MGDFRLKTYVVGMVSTNCYVIYHEQLKKAVIIDPGDNGEYILKKCQELSLKPEAILLTHGHCDHIMAVKQMMEQVSDIKLYASREEAGLLGNPDENLSSSLMRTPYSLEADYLVKDGEILHLAGFQWKVISTPGHTAGSVCYLIEDEGVLISGDTLFAESLGRTDLPTASPSAIISSIIEKLLILPDEIMVYPGHGAPTTIGHEKACNPVARYKGV